MQDIQFHVLFWAYVLLYCTALGLLLTVPKFSGKGWLILFLVIRCVMQGTNYIPLLLVRNGTYTIDQYQAFLDTWGFVIQLINAISYAVLVAFVLALKSTGGSHSGAFRSLFLFRGRVERQFFWIVVITLLAVNTLAWTIMTALATKNRPANDRAGAMVVVLCFLLWFLVSAWISLATQVKRWHDLDKSGWWVLIGLIPVIGWIWAVIETGFLKGTVGSNEFGPASRQQPLVSNIEGAATGTV